MFSLMDYRDTARRNCVCFVAALALALASSLPVVFADAQAASQSECIDEFNDSAASSTCELSSATASGDNCTFGGLCSHGGSWHNTSITVDIDNADDLVNCSGSLATSC